MIRITRQSRYMDRLRDYEIFIDNMYYGTIRDGENKEIDIDNGQHLIYIKIDWCRSNEINFVESANNIIEFQCGNSMKGLKRLLVLLYISVFKNKYLFLKIKDNI